MPSLSETIPKGRPKGKSVNTDKVSKPNPRNARTEIAKQLGVSSGNVAKAETVLKADPELHEEIKKNNVSVNKAHQKVAKGKSKSKPAAKPESKPDSAASTKPDSGKIDPVEQALVALEGLGFRLHGEYEPDQKGYSMVKTDKENGKTTYTTLNIGVGRAT